MHVNVRTAGTGSSRSRAGKIQIGAAWLPMPQAALTPEVAAAVAQQAVAYSAATVAEGFYTR